MVAMDKITLPRMFIFSFSARFLSKSFHTERQMEGSDNYESSCIQGTPVMKGSGSPSLTSSDSESESSNSPINHYHGLPVNIDGKVLLPEIKLKEELSNLEPQNQMDGEKENRSYEELLSKLIRTEEELRDANLKLWLSEKEVINSRSQFEKCEVQLDHVQKELQMSEAELEHEREKVLELQKQTADLETHVPDCCYKIAKLVEELAEAREQLKESDDEIAKLKNEIINMSCDSTHDLQAQLELSQQKVATLEAQLDSQRMQIREMEDRITWYKANESNHELEVQNLKAEILVAQAKFSLEREQLQSDILGLSEEKIQLDSALREWESRSHLLENKLSQCEAEKLKLEELHASQQIVLQGEINCLKGELGERRHEIEALNMEFDRQKQKYDILVAEKDGTHSKIHKLMGEARTRDSQIENMERELCQFHIHHEQLKSISEARLNLVNELKLKVEKLEIEVARQKAVISERAEEKREAIRQLCYSLEHYRSEYQELRQAFSAQNRQAVVTS